MRTQYDDPSFRDRTLMGLRESSILYAIHTAGGTIESNHRLQRMGYLAQKLGVPTNFDFLYMPLGPHSRSMDAVLDILKDARAIDVEYRDCFHSDKDYFLNNVGKKFIKGTSFLGNAHKDTIGKVVGEWNGKEVEDILKFVDRIWFEDAAERFGGI
jgi:hypothetical protein